MYGSLLESIDDDVVAEEVEVEAEEAEVIKFERQVFC
jgi:hypothetical protein